MISRVGSYLSQSVYSVATPFHPFGGAVDIIVVQQQDGSFRTTPWYVRFGKFQGVLKGAEKIVKIEVNGVEANFHMYLDNSGEAYFVKEVAPEKDNNVNDSVSLLESREVDFSPEKNNNVEVQFRDDHAESTESDSEKRFYEFQDEKSSSLDGSIDLYDNVEGDTESHNSEVVLFSIDGQILSAPITSMEENTENVQLSTPQFHLGPVETPEFGNDLEFSNDSTWAHYLSDLNRSKDKGSDNKVNLERELSIKSVVEDAPSYVKKEDVFNSCLALNDLGKQEESGDLEVDVENDEGVENVESSNLEVKSDEGVENVESLNLEVKCDEGVEKVESLTLEVETESTGVTSLAMEHKLSDVEIDKDQDREESEGVENSPNGLETRDESVTEMPQQYSDDNEHFDGPRGRGIELSLCGNLLRPGMGLSTAADTFNAHRIHEEEFRSAAASIIKNDSLVVKIEDKYFTWEKAAHIVLGMAAYGFEMPVEPRDAIPVEWSGPGDDTGLPSTPSRRWRLWPIPFRRVKTLDHNSSNLSGEDVFLDSESVFDSPQPVETMPTPSQSSKKQFVRTRVPTTEQISSLNLKDGQNMVSFIFSTRVLGVQKVNSTLAAANARLQDAREERLQFDEDNNEFLLNSNEKEDELSDTIISYKAEADTCSAFINFLEATWAFQSSFVKQRDKQVNDQLQTHESYFVNAATSFLSAYKDQLEHAIDSLRKLLKGLKGYRYIIDPDEEFLQDIEQREDLEQEYLDAEAKVIKIFEEAESIKELFYSAIDDASRKGVEVVNELCNDIEKSKDDFKTIKRPILRIEIPTDEEFSTATGSPQGVVTPSSSSGRVIPDFTSVFSQKLLIKFPRQKPYIPLGGSPENSPFSTMENDTKSAENKQHKMEVLESEKRSQFDKYLSNLALKVENKTMEMMSSGHDKESTEHLTESGTQERKMQEEGTLDAETELLKSVIDREIGMNTETTEGGYGITSKVSAANDKKLLD